MDKLNKSIKEIFNDYYIVPLYQRNFAWGEKQIVQLIQDIYENYKSSKDTNYYIGSLVALKRKDEKFEVIDGQQRLTVISLITKIFGINNEPRLKYDSRPEVEQFFDAFYQNRMDSINYGDYHISHFTKAIELIEESKIKIFEEGCEKEIPFTEIKKDSEFVNYFENKVIIVRVEIPEYTDVAAYFEIMNNRGEQLQEHEILKSLFLAKLREDDKKRAIFSKIWDACSEMDIPIQKSFVKADREVLFGNQYNEIRSCQNLATTSLSNKGFPISQILDPDFTYAEIRKQEDDDSDILKDDIEVESIIDFPNFLMHVFKLIYKGDYKIRLNEKYLLEDYRKIEKDLCSPMEFIDLLLTYRTIFDEYIVKVIGDGEEDDAKWILQKPAKYKKSWKYINTFGNKQDKILKALSMLQVTFRQRIYKNYLTKILEWIFNNGKLEINEDAYLSFLHSLMLDYFSSNYTEDLIEINSKDDLITGGTSIPHFIFNFIDYLYYYSLKTNRKDINNLDFIGDFEFTYRNSIEHHLPQSAVDQGFDKKLIDNLGNLCLVSKSMNSKMNNEFPTGKAAKSGKYYTDKLTPKRKIMYDLTNSCNSWGEKEITTHANDVISLLKKREDILRLK